MGNFSTLVVTVMGIVASRGVDEIPQEVRDNCSRQTKMCDRSHNECMKQLGPYDVIDKDSVMLPNNEVVKSQGPRNYRIRIPFRDRPKFPENVTYSVYRLNSTNINRDWHLPLLPIKECCDIPHTENCTLPGYVENTTLFLVMPYKDKSPWYLLAEISEVSPPSPYEECDSQTTNAPCYVMSSNGTFYVKKEWIPYSYSEVTVTMDFCFFSPSNEIETEVTQNGTLSFPRDDRFPRVETVKDCVPDFEGGNAKVAIHLSQMVVKPGEVFCYHFRFPRYNLAWPAKVKCFMVEDKGINKKTGDISPQEEKLYFHIVAGVVGSFILILAFVMGYCCRRYVTRKIKNSLPPTLIIAKMAFMSESIHRKSSLSSEDVSIEIYVPMEAGLPEDADKICSEVKEKAETWSSQDLPSIDQDGIYCSKFDMNTYIKVKQEMS